LRKAAEGDALDTAVHGVVQIFFRFFPRRHARRARAQ